MNTTIRNLDDAGYRALKARAALSRRTIGDLINEAIRSYLRRPDPSSQTKSLRDLNPKLYPKGTERLSEEINREVYGA
jgi:plasmid stability protein